MVENHEAMEKEILRVALDQQATRSYYLMSEKIKSLNPHVRIYPSQFVSFLMSDFFETYFEKDVGILMAEFFDSQSYCNAETEKAKGKPDYEEALALAASQAKKIKSKRRRKIVRRKRSKLDTEDSNNA